MRKLLALSLFFLTTQPIFGEIDYVTLYWRPDVCDERCSRLLELSLEKVEEASSVETDPTEGKAQLFWKARRPFEYREVNYAMKRIGVKLKDVGIRLRGTISQSGKEYFIHSIGDSTKLRLVSPPPPSTQEYVERKNILAYELTEELKAFFSDLEKKKRVVTVEGLLFEPYRPGLNLIVGQVFTE